MCTVTWLRRPAGYEVFFNRDELKTRPPALPPSLVDRAGVATLAPVDGEAGGAWIGANEFGVSLCLLNSYDVSAGAPPAWPISRGLLLVSLLTAATPDEVAARLHQQGLAAYQAFLLLIFALDQPVWLFTWNRQLLQWRELAESDLPLSTSSFSGPEVVAQRRACFHQYQGLAGGLSAEMLRAFHASHVPAAGAFSVCMHRAEAHTVSFSHLAVTSGVVRFHYQPGSPCSGVPALACELPVRPPRPSRQILPAKNDLTFPA